MGLFTKIWEAIKKVFKRDKIEQLTQLDVSVSETMQEHLDLWYQMYNPLVLYLKG